MSRRYMERATREGRVALLPEWLAPGREVWYWHESLCDGNGCMDMVSASCPLNSGSAWYDDDARDCARRHPSLEKTTIWSVCAHFTTRGVMWSVNDLPAVADLFLRSAYFRTRKEALENRPKEVTAGWTD